VSLVFITHRLEELEGLADSVTVLRDGACVQSSPFPDTSIDEILSHMVGGNLGRLFPDKTRLPGEVVLSLRGVGLDRRLGNIGFDLKSGEILGLGGFVGAGRTLLAEVLFGLHPRYSGEISLRGRAVRMTSPEQAQVLGIAFVSEDRKRTGVFPQLSVLENVSLLALTRIARRGWIPDTAERAAVLGVIDRLRAQRRDLADPISRLSGGNQQKCVLARWLLTEPWLLILDEPTRGIDVGARVELYNWFNRLAKDGLAILLISSDLRELEGMCDRIAVFREGRLVRMLEGGDANPREVVRYSALT
jgi:ABC-type sugar transport system ATPase subunit